MYQISPTLITPVDSIFILFCVTFYNSLLIRFRLLIQVLRKDDKIGAVSKLKYQDLINRIKIRSFSCTYPAIYHGIREQVTFRRASGDVFFVLEQHA